ncbi:MAG: TIGR03936 family radical SAM-associated protein [Clostridia bacterium]|nr:TIGR03936 family radical SAM-associated protein [Clostridia bacterium]
MPNFRVTFSKDDVLVYISHLDLNHAFIRALNRADVKLRFSEGFNPHPKIVFALPLSVGMEGENEIVDIGVADEEMTEEKLRDILTEQMPPHITVKFVVRVEGKLKDISGARYEIRISKSGIADKLSEFFKSEISVLKKTKSGEKQVVISGQIQKISAVETDGITLIDAVLDARADSYLNPELIMRAALDAGIISQSDAYGINRKEIYFGKNA